MSDQGKPTAPGWYEQSGNPGVLRWFDGQWWGTQSRPKTPEFPGISLAVPAAAEPARPSFDPFATGPGGDPFAVLAQGTGGRPAGRFGADAGDPFSPGGDRFPAPVAGPASAPVPPSPQAPLSPRVPPSPQAPPAPVAGHPGPGFGPPSRQAPGTGPAGAGFAAPAPLPTATPGGRSAPVPAWSAGPPPTTPPAWSAAPPATTGPAWTSAAPPATPPIWTGAPPAGPPGTWRADVWQDPWQARPATRYAAWGWRVLSAFIDYLAVAIPVWALSFVLAIVLVASHQVQTELARQQLALDLQGVLTVVGWIIWFVNRSVFGGRTGRSLGRVVTGTRLVRADTGQPLGVWLAFVRDVAHLLDSIALGLGYLWPLWDERRQTFADKAVSSVVVR